jgi:hypothetical protein
MVVILAVILGIFAVGAVYLNTYGRDNFRGKGFPETRRLSFWRALWK